MRAVIMRVLSASVTVDGEVVSAIEKGLLVLLGLGREDDPFPGRSAAAQSSSPTVAEGESPPAAAASSSSPSEPAGEPLICDAVEADLNWLAMKLTTVNYWPSAEGREWSLNLEQVGGDVLVVSQFTLHGIISKGKRPTFHRSLEPTKAELLYNRFIDVVQGKCKTRRVLGGRFGAMMEVELVNDGPVTFTVDTKDRLR